MVVTHNLLVIYNPASGRMRIEKAWHAFMTEASHDGYRCTPVNIQDAALGAIGDLSRFSAVVVIGGDGTLRTVVQFLYDRSADLPIMLVPRGSANLIAKSLSLPRSVKKALRVLRSGASLSVDIARLSNGTIFVGACAIGYLSHRVTSTPLLAKRLLGFAGYLWSFLLHRQLPLYTFSFSADGSSFVIQGHSLFIVNATNLFGVRSPRVADFQDGIFELAVTTNTSWIASLALLFDFYFRRSAPRHFMMVSGKRFSLRTEGIPALQVDGEVLPNVQRVDIEVLQKKQRFFTLKHHDSHQ
ncbi:MAG: diacylglycerol kinase family protein [Patescibacteria group bacterium]